MKPLPDIGQLFMDELKSDEAEKIYGTYDVQIPLFKPPEGFMDLFVGREVQVNINDFLETHNQCAGLSGSGKTEFLARFCEEMLLKKVKLAIIDSEKADFVSLHEMRGMDVKILKVIGNPVEVATKFFEGPSSYVFDRRGVLPSFFIPFFTEFFQTIYHLSVADKQAVDREEALARSESRTPKMFCKPMKFIIDEAHNFLPKDLSPFPDKEGKDQAKALIKIITDFGRECRAYGKTLFICSQRPTDVVTNLRTNTDGFFFFRQTSLNDLNFCVDVVPATKKADRDLTRGSLQLLKPGQCLFLMHGDVYRRRCKRRRTRHASKSITYANVEGWTSGG